MGRLSLILFAAAAFAQTQVDYPTQVKRKPALDPREYQFQRTNGFAGAFGASGDLSVAGAVVITLTQAPKGVAGTDLGHWLKISGGAGTEEVNVITGGTCDGTGQASCTVELFTVNTHTGAWKVTSPTAGIAEACRIGSSVYIPYGSYAIEAPINCPTPTAFQGPAMGDATLACTSLLDNRQMFLAPGIDEGYRWSGFTIDMTDCDAADAISITSETIRPYVDHVRVIYPDAGTGKALYLEGPGEVHVSNFITNNPGYCIDIQGDNAGGPGTEDFFLDVICDSPNTYGFRISRTTPDDVGAYYLRNVKITNPAGHTAGGFLFDSSVANTATVVFAMQCIADNIKGAPALDINNQATQHYINSWFVSGALTYSSGHSGVSVRGTTTEINFTDIQAQGHADGLLLDDAATSIRWIAGKLSGVDLACAAPGSGASCAIRVGASAVLNNIDIRAPIIDEVPMTDADQEKMILSGQQPLTFSAGKVYTLNNQGLPQTFCIIDKTVGADPTGVKCLGINNLGWFEMRNSVNTDIFVVTEAGIPAFPETDRMVIGGTNNTTLIFPVPASSIGLTFPSTGDTIVGRVTTDTLQNKTLVSPIISGSVSATYTLVKAVSSTGTTLQYLDWSSNPQSQAVVTSVGVTTCTITFTQGYVTGSTC